MGSRGMQDLPHLNLLLPLLHDPSRLISVFKLASSPLLTNATCTPRNRRTIRKLSDGTAHKGAVQVHGIPPLAPTVQYPLHKGCKGKGLTVTATIR